MGSYLAVMVQYLNYFACNILLLHIMTMYGYDTIIIFCFLNKEVAFWRMSAFKEMSCWMVFMGASEEQS